MYFLETYFMRNYIYLENELFLKQNLMLQNSFVSGYLRLKNVTPVLKYIFFKPCEC